MEKSITGQLPFEGGWISTATPADKIPSHDTFKFGVGYAYDFVKVDASKQKLQLEKFSCHRRP